MLETEKLARRFAGKPEGQGAPKPGKLLAAFKAAAPHMGFSPRVVHAIDWLFAFTKPQDWAEGSRPIVWPSAETQRHALNLGASQTKALNRTLVELGLIVMKDGPHGWRRGSRDATGRITEAYGFDLSPIGVRRAEFEAAAAAGREEHKAKQQLRRRAAIARNGIAQIVETASELGFTDDTWPHLEEEASALVRALAKVERVEDLAIGVASLERRQAEARERFENQLPPAAETSWQQKADNSGPQGPIYQPHNTYESTAYPKDTVEVHQGGSPPADREVPAQIPPKRSQVVPQGQPAGMVKGTALRLRTDELVRLAPRLQPYLLTSIPSWPDVVDAADRLRHDLGVDQHLWGEACRAMGREQAAIAVAIVSAKPAGHITASPGGYFHGMVAKAKAGELNLDRTIWGMRARGGTAASQRSCP
jgi:replication initiation protein RepC